MENTFRPSRFLSLRATTPSPCTWEEIMQELTGERHAATTTLFRALAAGEGQDAETSKRQQSQIKQNQPAFVPSVHLEGGRSSKHIKGYPGSIMVDIDGIPEEIFDETLERVRADPHSFLAYKTLSGRGIRVIAWMEGEVTEENFPAAWQTVNAYYARLTGIAIDRQCKNATRMSVICHDPDALYRPDAERMKFASLPDAKAGQKQDIAAGKKHRGRKTSAARAENTVRRLVEEEGVHYAAGSHNDYISRCLYLMNRFGVPEAEAEAWAVELFADYDTASVRSTAKSCYALTAEHATMKLSDVSPPQRERAAAQGHRRRDGALHRRLHATADEPTDTPARTPSRHQRHPRTRRLGSHDRHGRELPLVLHAPRRVGGRPLPPAHAPALRLRAPLPPVGGVSRKGRTVGWRDGPYRQPGCNGAPRRQRHRSFRPLFPPLVRRDGRRRARSEGGEPRHPRPDRAAGMLQDIILPEPPATRPQTLLCLQDQLATAHEGRPLHHDGELARQFRGDRLHAAQ